MCHRFEMLSGEEAGAVVDWLRAVRRALVEGRGAAVVTPPVFGRPAAMPLEAIDCYPGRESPVIVAAAKGADGDGPVDGKGAPCAWCGGSDFATESLVWGIEVPWKRGPVFNARIESALSGSGMWHEAMEHGRCIVPVRAFYETRSRESAPGAGAVGEGAAASVQGAADDPPELTRGAVADIEQGILGLEDAPAAGARPRGRRPQYRFAAAGGTALLLAGLRIGDRFALVTCEPDVVVGTVHHRMPLSLTAPEALAWLAAADARSLLNRAPIPLTATEEPAPVKAPKQPADPDQMSLF